MPLIQVHDEIECAFGDITVTATVLRTPDLWDRVLQRERYLALFSEGMAPVSAQNILRYRKVGETTWHPLEPR